MWSKEARYSSLESRCAEYENKARDRINSVSGFQYAGGYTGTDGVCRIKCLKCGAEWEQNYQPVRKGRGIRCPVCSKREHEEQKELQRLEHEAAVIERMMKSYRTKIEAAKMKAKEEESKVHLCPICGRPTVRHCCSDECQRTYNNRAKDQNRRAKIRNALIDSDITLPELYRRDGGVCHICGGLCDWTDCDQQADGTIIAGDYYPSIDHVKPLSKGGLHSWENVRLSHRICNSIKSDSYIPLSK